MNELQERLQKTSEQAEKIHALYLQQDDEAWEYATTDVKISVQPEGVMASDNRGHNWTLDLTLPENETVDYLVKEAGLTPADIVNIIEGFDVFVQALKNEGFKF